MNKSNKVVRRNRRITDGDEDQDLDDQYKKSLSELSKSFEEQLACSSKKPDQIEPQAEQESSEIEIESEVVEEIKEELENSDELMPPPPSKVKVLS